MDTRVFIFSKEEFLLLMAIAGIRQIYGFSLGEDIQKSETILGLQKLMEKGIVYSSEEQFHIRPDVAEMFEQIKNAATTVEVRKRSGRKCMIYIARTAVKVSFSKIREGMLEIQSITKENLWHALEEEGWIL